MKVQFGKGKKEYGPGVEITLTGDEIATAIHAYLVAHSIYTQGPRTITVNGDLCKSGSVYIDPLGVVIAEGVVWKGNGNKVK